MNLDRHSGEISRNKKFHLIAGIIMYFTGFFLLSTLGDAINENPYHWKGIVSCLFLAISLVYIPYNLCRKG